MLHELRGGYDITVQWFNSKCWLLLNTIYVLRGSIINYLYDLWLYMCVYACVWGLKI